MKRAVLHIPVIVLLAFAVSSAWFPLPAPLALPAASSAAGDMVWICPMDKDIRSLKPGNCPRCGMKLTSGIPDTAEYHLDLSVSPETPQAQQPVHLTFEVHDPWKNNIVTKFTPMHERLFHVFIVSEDLEVFVHDHPVWKGTAFHYDMQFPKPGLYRILGDFYPEAATPQLIAESVLVPGPVAHGKSLMRDYSTKRAENMSVELKSIPAVPVAGQTIQLRFHISPAEGFEKYLGAWGHMLVASDDLIDMIHTHPFFADGGADVQFNVIFPRARMHRVWVQFQRNGIINTVHFDVPVNETAVFQ